MRRRRRKVMLEKRGKLERKGRWKGLGRGRRGRSKRREQEKEDKVKEKKSNGKLEK